MVDFHRKKEPYTSNFVMEATEMKQELFLKFYGSLSIMTWKCYGSEKYSYKKNLSLKEMLVHHGDLVAHLQLFFFFYKEYLYLAKASIGFNSLQAQSILALLHFHIPVEAFRKIFGLKIVLKK